MNSLYGNGNKVFVKVVINSLVKYSFLDKNDDQNEDQK